MVKCLRIHLEIRWLRYRLGVGIEKYPRAQKLNSCCELCELCELCEHSSDKYPTAVFTFEKKLYESTLNSFLSESGIHCKFRYLAKWYLKCFVYSLSIINTYNCFHYNVHYYRLALCTMHTLYIFSRSVLSQNNAWLF